METVTETDTLPGALRARAKRLVVIGALVLWVVSPLLIGAWVTVAAKLANRGHVGAGLYAVMIVWALVCLVALLAGFAMLLGGVFFWWRSRTFAEAGSTRGAQRRSSSASAGVRAQMLREMQEQLRAQDAVDADTAGDRVDEVIDDAESAVARHDDSDVPHARR